MPARAAASRKREKHKVMGREREKRRRDATVAVCLDFFE